MQYPVSNDQLQVIVGGLLGDSHIRRKAWNGKFCNAHLMFAQGERQKEYLEWKLSMLGDLAKGKLRKRPATRTNGEPSLTYASESISSPKLNPFWELFGRPKQVTRKILNLLDPLGLAVWYMDDGTLMIEYHKRLDGNYGIKRRRIALCTDCFSLKEHYLMQQYFKVVWDIDVSIYKIKNTKRLSMNYTNAQKFVELIKDHIHPSMMYKIDFNRERDYQNALPSLTRGDDIV